MVAMQIFALVFDMMRIINETLEPGMWNFVDSDCVSMLLMWNVWVNGYKHYNSVKVQGFKFTAFVLSIDFFIEIKENKNNSICIYVGLCGRKIALYFAQNIFILTVTQCKF